MFFWGVGFSSWDFRKFFNVIYFLNKDSEWNFFEDEDTPDSIEDIDIDTHEVLINYFLLSFFVFIAYLLTLAYIYPTIEELVNLIFNDILDTLSVYFKNLNNINKLVLISVDSIIFMRQYNLEIFSKIDLYIYIFYND